jgi:ribosome-associated toxin RatA of RatAB toxin-antitoxin module
MDATHLAEMHGATLASEMHQHLRVPPRDRVRKHQPDPAGDPRPRPDRTTGRRYSSDASATEKEVASMPVVDVSYPIRRSPDEVWKVVANFDDFPRVASAVRGIETTPENDQVRRTRWQVMLDDSELEWLEEDVLDPIGRRIDFRILEGDLVRMEGSWTVTAAGVGSVVDFQVDFDLGIPLLADLLNPIAEQSLRRAILDVLTHITPGEAS